MRKVLIAAAMTACAMLSFTSAGQNTYTLQEIEAMKKSGRLSGNERFVLIEKEETPGLLGGKKGNAALMPGSDMAVPAVGFDAIAYDKIGGTRYLITMAREYYGNGDFWPYIYEENKTKLDHPDRIIPGTTVCIPCLKKYGVDPKNPADVEKARKKGREIYARYGKHM